MQTTPKHSKDTQVDRVLPESRTNSRFGISISVEQMELVRLAYLSDRRLRRRPSPSAARWIIRAFEPYLALDPLERYERRRELDESLLVGRKLPHNLSAPVTLRGQVERAVAEEREAGRDTNGSELAREALGLAIMAATARAGGSLPVVVRA